MEKTILVNLPDFLDTLGIEEPMGIYFSDRKPEIGFSPKEIDLPTREKEKENAIDWQGVFNNFSCAIGHIWRARKKKTAAYFSNNQFGCPGCAFWMGFMKPQTEMIVHFVSSGIPNQVEGELYCQSPDEVRRMFEYVDPEPVPKKYIIFKPIGQFSDEETPELVAFFTRPESLCGLQQLAAFVTNDPEVVASPWSTGCGSLVAWPRHYATKGQNKAVMGGWDATARKFYKTDELSFTVPFSMFKDMLVQYKSSFLSTKTWATVQKKIEKSKKAWGE